MSARKLETVLSDKTIELTSDNFEGQVLQSDQPVLVDFWAVWCGPCRMVAPIIDELADEYSGKVKIGKLNVDEHGDIAMRYNVRSIPTLLMFRSGEVVDQMVGAGSKTSLSAMIDKATSGAA